MSEGVLSGRAAASDAVGRPLVRYAAAALALAIAALYILIALQVVTVASSRSPHFEVWGLTVKVAQVALLLLLLYLGVRSSSERADPRGSATR
jgi:hypothetical protein